MLMRITNDRLKATLHKVEAPPTIDDEKKYVDTGTLTTTIPERFSIAFFCNINKDVMLESLTSISNDNNDYTSRYSPINAHDYITKRLKDTINN
jgi:isopenicillin N synthase-like dioxygenase